MQSKHRVKTRQNKSLKRQRKDLGDLVDRTRSKSKRIALLAQARQNLVILMITSFIWSMMLLISRTARLKRKSMVLMIRRSRMNLNRMRKWRRAKRKNRRLPMMKLFKPVNLQSKLRREQMRQKQSLITQILQKQLKCQKSRSKICTISQFSKTLINSS